MQQTMLRQPAPQYVEVEPMTDLDPDEVERWERKFGLPE